MDNENNRENTTNRVNEIEKVSTTDTTDAECLVTIKSKMMMSIWARMIRYLLTSSV